MKLSEEQAQLRISNQVASAKHKSHGRPAAKNAVVFTGSLVYIKSEQEKHKARDRYLVTDINGDCCTVQKFVKSQLRSQKYQLKLSEVYPVLPEEIELPGPIRGLDCGRDMEGSDEPQNESVELMSQSDLECNRSASGLVIPADNARNTDTGPPAAMHMEELPTVTQTVDSNIETLDVAANEAVSHESSPGCEVVSLESVEDVNVNVGRPRRERSQPKWLSSGDYVVG